MAKKTLTERFVQNTVAEKLNKEYYRRKSTFVATEAYTKLKRADVFLAFMRTRNRPYVVVVEAKSRTTIHQLKLKESPQLIRRAGHTIALLLIVGLSATLGYQWYFNAVNTLLLLGVFVLGSSAISVIIGKLELSALSSISAIEQLGRYPANEKWIAVGEDTFARPADYQTLYRQCKKNGIGLIVVTAKGKMQRKLNPEPRHAFNNYLDRYGKEATILKKIEQRPDYGPTPPEQAKRFRQMLNIAVLLALTGLFGLIGYEENYRPVVPDPFDETYVSEVFEPVDTTPLDPGAGAGATVNTEELTPISVECAGFRVNSRSFVVVDAILNRKKADERLKELAQAGLTNFRLTPTECLNSWPAPGRFAVYQDTVYAQRPEAKRAAKAHKERLAIENLSFKYGRAVKVRPR